MQRRLAQKQIKFNTPPAAGQAITDFSVEYIPKSTNFVLDVQAEMLFGEGVIMEEMIFKDVACPIVVIK